MRDTATAAMTSFLEQYFLIKRGEIPRVFFAFLLIFILGSNLVITGACKNALYLSKGDISSLPYLLIVEAVTLICASMLYSRIADAFAKNRTMYLLYSIYSGSLIGLYFLSLNPVKWFYPFLYVFGGVVIALSNLKGWTFISEVFNPREARRLFAVIGMGLTVAYIVAGFGVKAYTKVFPANSLLLLCAGCLFLAIPITHALKKTGKYSFTPAKSKKKGTSSIGLRTVFKNRYLILMALLVSLGGLGSIFADYIFKISAKAAYSGDELAGFYGLFFGISNIAVLAYGVLFSTRALGFLGIRNSLLILPLELGIATLIFGFFPTVMVASAIKFGTTGLRYSIYNMADQVMYLPLNREFRGRFKTYIGGVIRPASIIAAGLLLLLISQQSGPENLFPFLIALGVISFLWVIACIPAKKEYSRELYNSLELKGVDLEDLTEVFNDPATVRILERELDSDEPARVIYVLQLLDLFGLDMKGYYLKALDRGQAEIAKEILPEIEKLRAKGLYEALMEKLDTFDDLKGQIFRAASAGDPEKASAETEHFLKDPKTREDAVFSMIRYMDEEESEKGREICYSWAQSTAAEDRLASARVISLAGFSPCRRTSSKLLKDDDPEIRNLVLSGIRVTPEPGWAEVVLAHLFNPATKQSCLRLVSIFPSIGERLRVLYKNRNKYDEKAILIEAMHRAGGEENIAFLCSLLPHADAGLKHRIAETFADLFERPGAPPVPREAFLSFAAGQTKILMAIKSYLNSETVRNDYQIRGMVKTAFDLRMENVFAILGTMFGESELHAACISIRRGYQSANAVELLDSRLAWKDRKPFITLLEERPENISEKFKKIYKEDIPGMQTFLTKTDDRILNALGIYISCLDREDTDLSPYVQVLDSEDELILETAVVSLARKINEESAIEMYGSERAEPILTKGVGVISTMERLLFLQGTDIFKELTGEYLHYLAKTAAELRFLQGDVICEDGDIDRSMFIVVQGRVDVEKNGKKVAELEKGACIGEMALLDGEPRSATVRALSETTCLKIEYSDFYEVMAGNVAIAKGIIRVLTGRLRSMLSAEESF